MVVESLMVTRGEGRPRLAGLGSIVAKKMFLLRLLCT